MIRIRCLVCREAFRWDTEHGMPNHCPICKEYIGSDDKDEVAAPFISKASNLGADRVYRDMERKSEVRTQMAAEQLGMSVSELSHMKTTNMKDGQREGDVAAANNLTPIQQSMAAQSSYGNAEAIRLSAATNTGPFPRAGTNYIQNVLRPSHMKDAAAVRQQAARSSKG